MKWPAIWMCTLVFILTVFFSCRKEYSIENNRSSGSLVGDPNNNCTASPMGQYVTGKKLGDSNFILAQLYITKKGSFGVTTDTVNGYSFYASGNFNDTGLVQLRLLASGSPRNSGTDLFTIRYDSSFCTVNVAVADTAKIAVYTLQGSPNSCLSDTVKGSFIKGFALDTSAKIVVTVDVTAVGSYSITTDTVNGYYFSGASLFAQAGLQTILLAGKGTPLAAGNDIFRISGASSSCHFINTVFLPTGVGTNPDHFPLTNGSFWNYDDLFYKGDTIGRVISGTTITNGNTYSVMQETHPLLGLNQYFFRKSGNDYFDYCPVDKYTSSMQYAPSVIMDLNFLKEGLNTGDSWESPTFSGPATFGQTILLKYAFACKNANAAVVVNNKAFTNVYIITMRPMISAVGYSPGPTGELYTFYYAKGVGLVYYDEFNMYYTQPKLQIRNWSVN
jgi:hypothetical protein